MIPVVESSIIRHNVPTATGAMIIGIKKIDVASLAQRRSEQSAIATNNPTNTSSVTDTTANSNVFSVLT